MGSLSVAESVLEQDIPCELTVPFREGIHKRLVLGHRFFPAQIGCECGVTSPGCWAIKAAGVLISAVFFGRSDDCHIRDNGRIINISTGFTGSHSSSVRCDAD